MKFIKEVTPKGLLLPVTAARLAGFSAGEKAEYHTLNGAMLVLKGRMTAPELLAVVHQLTSASAQLLHHLSQVCGYCEDCDKDSCPYNDFEEETVSPMAPSCVPRSTRRLTPSQFWRRNTAMICGISPLICWIPLWRRVPAWASWRSI